MKKNCSFLFLFIFLYSCTSNTIFEAPKDLIPRDTMVFLIQEMMIASSAKYIKNSYQQKNINYMAFVYDKYKIDSLRFQKSNFYYTTKIDLYQEILTDVKNNLDRQKSFYRNISNRLDSIRRDSIGKNKIEIFKKDTIKNPNSDYNFHLLFL